MNRKQKLLEERAKHWAEAQDYRERHVAGGELSVEDRAGWSHALDEVDRIDRELDGASGATDGRDARPSADPYGGAGSRSDWYADGNPLPEDRSMVEWLAARRDISVPTEHRNLSLRKYLRGMVTGDWTDADAERRAMQEGTGAAGGYMVPAPLSAQIIDLARAKTRVFQAGARLVPMESKTLDVARWDGDPSAAWHSESAAISTTDGSIGSVKLEAKSLASLVKASRELIEDANAVEDELRDAFAAQFALAVDMAALYGSGTEPEPRGVKNTSGITVQSMGTDGATPTNYNFLVDAIGALQDANEDPTASIMAPRTERTIAKFEDTTGQPLRAPRLVENLPRYATTQVPVNLTQGTSTDASDVFTADWRKLLVGVRTRLEIRVLAERYADTGELGFIAWWRGDVAVARGSAFVVTTGVRSA